MLTPPSSPYIVHLDGVSEIPGGWVSHNWKQLYIQLADSVAGASYSFFGSLIILYCIQFLSKLIPALALRATPEEEDMGMDDVEIGEFAVSTTCSRLRMTACLTWYISTITLRLRAI